MYEKKKFMVAELISRDQDVLFLVSLTKSEEKRPALPVRKKGGGKSGRKPETRLLAVKNCDTECHFL